jgi:uncharacterized Zn finger protein
MDDVSVAAGDPIAYAGSKSCKNREERALRLFERRGRQIAQAGEGLYYCPSWDGSREYTVHYPVGENETETCTCPDHVYRGAVCLHIMATAIRVAKVQARNRQNLIHAFLGDE